MNVLAHNRAAWNQESLEGSRWTRPVDSSVIERARQGDWFVLLTPQKPVPREWLGIVEGKEVLCLASGGGQQAPILAAAGARVTSFDLSEEQLAQDQLVAERDGLEIKICRGDMADLSPFADHSFDLVFHPSSNLFTPDVHVVWRECFRVLRPGGRLLAGFMNPSYYLFDHAASIETGELIATASLPYSDIVEQNRNPNRKAEIHDGMPFEFGHLLQDQIGGQLRAGFLLAGLYEDWWDDAQTPLNRLSPTTLATLALKMDHLL